jgi:farnesyl-diphosphate farnesyltransferase
MNAKSLERYLLHGVLKQVSRSFYLTLAVLPGCVAKQLGLAYLFARAADTIADAGRVDRTTRVGLLRQLKLQFVQEACNHEDVKAIQAETAPQQEHPGERTLLEHLDRCFLVYENLMPADRAEIRHVLPILISGMETDLERFTGESEADLVALSSLEDLDDYTYRIAGCVGEFWTKIMYAHLPRIHRTWDREAKIRTGIRFGKGLQLTNILKDLSTDLRRGRCYIPLEMLASAGLEPRDLLDTRTMANFSPVLHALVQTALAHLDHGWLYATSIPRRDLRLRLACMWPILIALKTLHLLTTCDNLLDPARKLKISRYEVYRIIATSTLTGTTSVGTAYWGHLRKAVG